ncbi:hypothetical protein FB45DRAFT_830479 [Roridomyces roridus]|uniref:Transmembrane protein n=1 Tax=Roridomyces roridus TaxID=1738132 RepID=A0AAD7BZK7_9AGAR|nr:hypothetical protein FB45DRAFT_830479 [Roridomyces roridus]
MQLAILLWLAAHPLIQATQFPLQSPLETTAGWDDLDAGPQANETAHLTFETANSLLQHWPNTRYRNGHTIVPGTIPVGTLLHHGRSDQNVPTFAEWTTMDPEHAYLFCGNKAMSSSEFFLMFVVTRPLKVVYFDGSSGANMKDGSLDMQDLLLWGKARPDRWMAERARIDGLCEWGREFGVDGEVMLCSFSSGVELLSANFLAAMWSRDITAPQLSRFWHSTEFSGDEPNMDPLIWDLVRFESIRAGKWHERYPGETRVSLDMARSVSLYDTSLAPSLVAARAGKERWDHRIEAISAVDLVAVKQRLREVLADSNTEVGSGIDSLYRVVVKRYADRLELLHHLLNTTDPNLIQNRTRVVQRQLRIMLTPYILYSVQPAGNNPDDDSWAAPIWHACATQHTAHIHTRAHLTPSECVLLSALDGTNREICRVVVRMWVAGVRAGLDMLLPGSADTDVSRVFEDWRTSADSLVSWLDWSVWVKCRPECSAEEICYLPTWPWFWDEWMSIPEDGEWKRPQPRCIRQVEPYSSF